MSGGWSTSDRRSRLPANWYAEIRPAVLDGRPCQIRWDAGCEGVATEVDHIRRGDDHSMTNLQPACAWCHARKSSAEGHAARRYYSARRRPESHPGLR